MMNNTLELTCHNISTGRNVAYRYRGEEDSKYHVKHALAIFTVASSSFTHLLFEGQA